MGRRHKRKARGARSAAKPERGWGRVDPAALKPSPEGDATRATLPAERMAETKPEAIAVGGAISAASTPGTTVCQICGDAMADGRVWCVDCGTPSHRDCFSYNGRCPVYGCTGMRYKTVPGRDRGVTWIEIRDERGDPSPQGYVVEFTSFREGCSFAGACIFGFFALVAAVPPKGKSGPFPFHPEATGILLGIMALWVALRVLFKDYRIVDGKTRKIWLHRSFAGWKSLSPEIDFAEVTRLVLTGRWDTVGKQKRTGFQWRVKLHRRLGAEVALTNEEFHAWSQPHPAPPPSNLLSIARRVGQILGREVQVERTGQPGQ